MLILQDSQQEVVSKMEKTIKDQVSSQIVEKKSKFIANFIYVSSLEEAEEKLESIRKKYREARHHCYAYRIKQENGIIERASDDGEPKGTAGAPILNIIQKNEFINVLLVVTRYFGGILLGTGGLVKAYSEATLEAMKQAKCVIEKIGIEWEIEIPYSDLETLEYYCRENDILIIEKDYDNKIKCKLELTEEEKDKIVRQKEEIKIRIENSQIIRQKNIRKHEYISKN